MDLSVVVGALPDRPGLVARRIGTVRWALCAAPANAEVHGLPTEPDQLSGHACLRLRGLEPQESWTLEHVDGRRIVVAMRGGFDDDAAPSAR